MRILVAGASGRTGRLFVERALAGGHEVTALVRASSRGFAPAARLSVAVADVLDELDLAGVVAGHDAVVSLLAPRPRTSGRVYVQGTRHLADAAACAGVRRLVVVSAEGAGVEPDRLPLGYRIVRRIPVVSRLYPDIARMEDEVRARTDLDWTVVRPAILTGGPGGGYRVEIGAVVPGGVRVSRADLARFLLEVLETGGYVREVVAIAR